MLNTSLFEPDKLINPALKYCGYNDYKCMTSLVDDGMTKKYYRGKIIKVLEETCFLQK